MKRIVYLVVGVLALATLTPLTGQCNPPTIGATPITWDVLIDDTAPWGLYLGPGVLPHANALKVTSGDFTNDNFNEVIIGGIYDPAVQIYYFHEGGHNFWMPRYCFESPPYGIGYSLPFDSVSVAGAGTTSIYDFEVGYINDDLWLDVVVGRRLAAADVLLPPEKRDTVFLNAGGNPDLFPAGPDWCDDIFPDDGDYILKIPNGQGQTTGATLAIALGNIDEDANTPGPIDLVRGGSDYAIQYYTGLGTGGFVWRKKYTDGEEKNYRDIQLADIDGDGDTDMLASRLNADFDPADNEHNSV